MDEYDKRCANTLAMRIVLLLRANGHISEIEADDLLYPSQEALEEAEEQME